MTTISNDLSEFSASYYQEADYYKLFSDAEDKEGYIWQQLEDLFTNKSVLDLGCGNGRYLELIDKVTKNCIGIDQSLSQIQQGKSNLPFMVADGANLPFNDNSFDYVLSCWVWGTILDEEKRQNVLSEAQRVTKPGGSIILVENDNNSEFEYYRGRHLNTKTTDYNHWLLQRGFETFKQLEIFFTFECVQTAQAVFKQIWKDRLFDLPNSKKIQSNIIIFQMKID